MKTRLFLTFFSMLLLTSCQTTTQTLSGDLARLGNSIFSNTNVKDSSGFTNQELSAAFKQALTMGTNQVVSQLGAKNGFNLDPQIHIPLPENLERVQTALNTVGLSHLMDDLELRLNRAAEIAMPEAKELFMNSIQQLTFRDVVNIYKGPNDSATRYFETKMSNSLANRMRPIVNDAIAEAGVVKAYDNVMAQYAAIPSMPDIKADLTNHVIDLGIDGVFFYLAKQEAEIRKDSRRHTTDLLKRVFGGVKKVAPAAIVAPGPTGLIEPPRPN